MQIPRSGRGPVEARLGDLDLKSSNGEKARYWKSTEKELIDQGWYTLKKDCDSSRKTECYLSLA